MDAPATFKGSILKILAETLLQLAKYDDVTLHLDNLKVRREKDGEGRNSDINVRLEAKHEEELVDVTSVSSLRDRVKRLQIDMLERPVGTLVPTADNVVSDLAETLLAALPNLESVEFRSDFELRGVLPLQELLEGISRGVSRRQLHFDIRIEGIKDETSVTESEGDQIATVLDSVSGAKSLMLGGRITADSNPSVMGSNLARLLERNMELVELEIAIDNRAPIFRKILRRSDIDSAEPDQPYQPASTMKPLKLERLEIGLNQLFTNDGLPDDYGPLEAFDIARLGNLRELLITRQFERGWEIVSQTEFELWSLFIPENIWLKTVGVRYLNDDVLKYLSAPELGKSLRNLDLQGFYNFDTLEEYEILSTTFREKVLPNICASVEDLRIWAFPPDATDADREITNFFRLHLRRPLYEGTIITLLRMCGCFEITRLITGEQVFATLRHLTAMDTMSLQPEQGPSETGLKNIFDKLNPSIFPKLTSIELYLVCDVRDASDDDIGDMSIPVYGAVHWSRVVEKINPYLVTREAFRSDCQLRLNVVSIMEGGWWRSEQLEYRFAGDGWCRGNITSQAST